MELTLSEKREFMKRIEQMIYLDVLNRNDVYRINKVCAAAASRELEKVRK